MKKIIVTSFLAIIILLTVPLLCTVAARVISERAISAGRTVGSVAKKYIPGAALLSREGGGMEKAASSDAVGKRLVFLISAVSESDNEPDVILLLSMDSDGGSPTVLHIPHNAYINCNSYGNNSLASVYSYSYTQCLENGIGKSEARHKANMSLASFLEQTLSIDIDSYFSLSDKGFAEIIDTLGSVVIKLPCDIELENEGLTLFKGKNRIDGKLARSLIASDGSFNADIPKLLLYAIGDKLKSGLTLPRIISLSKKLHRELVTDMTFGHLAFLAPSAIRAASQKTKIITASGETKDGLVYLDKAALYENIRRYLFPSGLSESSLNIYG